MSDYSLPLKSTLIAGIGSAGKTTLVFRYLLNVRAACRFVFDDRGQCANRLNVRHVGTANECEAALSTRWVVFNPSRMFPGCLPGTEEGENAFCWFCKWVYDASCRGRGPKKFVIDEPWKWMSTRKFPRELAVVIQEGRVEDIEVISVTNTPQNIPFPMRSQATEVICFRLGDDKQVEALETLQLSGFNEQKMRNLPLGTFMAWDRIKNTSGTGRIF